MPFAVLQINSTFFRYMLPDMSGIEICRQIKGDTSLKDIFVILASGIQVSQEIMTVILLPLSIQRHPGLLAEGKRGVLLLFWQF